MKRKRLIVVVICIAGTCLLVGFGWYWFHDRSEILAGIDTSYEEFNLSKVELPARKPPVTKASLKPYDLKPDLPKVKNRYHFLISPEQYRQLSENHLIVFDAGHRNPVEVYENTSVPFVTSDILLHVFHVLTEDSLAKLEQQLIRPALEAFLKYACAGNIRIYDESEGEVHQAAKTNIVRFSLALKFLDDDFPVPKSVQADVERILEAIRNEQDFKFNGRTIEGTRFRPRARYSSTNSLNIHPAHPENEEQRAAWKRLDEFVGNSTEALGNYFRAIIWLQQSSWDIEKRRDLLGIAAFAQSLRDSEDAQNAYSAFAHGIDIFAEQPDGVTPLNVLEIAEQELGKHFKAHNLSDDDLDSFRKALLAKYELRILGRLEGPMVTVATAPKLIFTIPGRYNLTGDLFQRILEEWKEMPSGVDYASIILGADIKPKTKFKRALEMADEVKLRSEDEWFGSVEGGVQYAMKSLVDPVPEGFPTFMYQQAWRKKSINTALGSFVQLNHLLFLYAKHSEAFGLFGPEDQPFVGYVEPNPEFYSRLAYCVGALRMRLKRLGHFERLRKTVREIFGEETYQQWFEGKDEVPPYGALCATEKHFKDLEDGLKTFQEMAQKELDDVLFTEQEQATLKHFGDAVKYWTFDTGGYNEKSLICDVATEHLEGKSLQVATGRPLVIMVVVPRYGRLYLAKGSIFSYYEFEQPIADKMTGEQWRAKPKDASNSWLGQQKLISKAVKDRQR